MTTVVFYVSGHGFGHSSRQSEVIRSLLARCPDLEVIVRTSAPAWLFENGLGDQVRVDALNTDTGVIQVDSLTVDVDASISSAWAFHERLDEFTIAEALRLKACHAALVIGDIPPLAFGAAARAGIPSAAIGNFTWDWIYEGYPVEVARVPALLPLLRDTYREAVVAWRLPLHAGFEIFRHVVDVPLVARCSTRNPDEVRHLLDLPSDAPLVLFTFGRYGLPRINWSTVAQLTGYHVVLATSESQLDQTTSYPGGPFVRVNTAVMEHHGLRYEDLVAAVEVVIAKPGYGIIAECAANDTAMLYTSRGRFREYKLLTDGMPELIRSEFIAQDELFRGSWQVHIDTLLAQPPRPRPDVKGADVIADGLLEML